MSENQASEQTNEPEYVIDDPLLEAGSLEEMGALLNEQAVRAGQIVEAVVKATNEQAVGVDIEDVGVAWIPVAEFEALPAQGDEVRVYVEWLSEEGPRLSRQKARQLDLWARLEDAARNLDAIEGVVLAETRDGYSVDVGLKATLAPNQLAGTRGVELIGQTLELYVLHADSRRMRLELSQRKPKSGPAKRLDPNADVFEQLVEGQNIIGRVDRLTDFGAFVDLGGFDGLLHVNDLAWGRVKHPKEVVRVGDELAVQVLEVDRERRRVSLGLKQLTPDPWSTAAERYPNGKRVSGTVISLTAYGAFVEVEPGVEALIHVSEMAWNRVKHPKEVVRKGQTVEAAVLNCEPHARRLKLSFKPLLPNPWEAVAERYPPGTVIRGKVRNILEWGIFIGVEKGIDGLVHVTDLAWGNAVREPAEHFRKGQEVEAMVLEVDPERERMSLGVKQLKADSTRSFFADHAPGDVLSGEVTGLAEFGAFVRVGDGLEGLVHLSELSESRVDDPADVVKVGQTVNVVILALEPEATKISLSMKQTEQPEVEEAEAAPAEEAEASPAEAAEAAPTAEAEAAPAEEAEASPAEAAEAAPTAEAEASPAAESEAEQAEAAPAAESEAEQAEAAPAADEAEPAAEAGAEEPEKPAGA